MTTPAEIRAIHDLPIPELLFRAAAAHRAHWDPEEIQFCTLDSIKTGACPEDCAYCPQSARYDTGLKVEPMKELDAVLEGARAARDQGSTRYCMGASWREVRDDAGFEAVLAMVRGVADLGMEVCVTLGMLDATQARRLKEAGCKVYNHNIDSSKDFYETIVSTRKFDQRLRTIDAVRQAGLEVCCGGIVGMGETIDHRVHFLHELTQLDPPPESIPINHLVPVAGTPLADLPPVPPLEFIRMIATARILFPASRIRLSAGRTAMSDEMQALAFLAGANSLFTGDKLLTTPNPGENHDRRLLAALGMRVEGARV
ncbi:biotin synthase BioB [Mesoterricola silvestris]|uniref:Biotin synthase n=1 Tax=Mesoterricola silvestris TaxID=2927979 RepID=A0AA48GI53_9BACT|nr:biotin synthase BioB [Mesoterricola silvestris]BDU71697.1 biotin synthase [Mesoterricola silvestris]